MTDQTKDTNCECGCTEHDHEMDEATYITLEFEDGTEVECEVLDTITLEGKNYMALQPENQEEYYIYGYNEVDDGVEIINIDDEVEFNNVVNEFQSRFEALAEMEDDEEDDDDDEEEEEEVVEEEEKK